MKITTQEGFQEFVNQIKASYGVQSAIIRKPEKTAERPLTLWEIGELEKQMIELIEQLTKAKEAHIKAKQDAKDAKDVKDGIDGNISLLSKKKELGIELFNADAMLFILDSENGDYIPVAIEEVNGQFFAHEQPEKVADIDEWILESEV